MICLADPKVKRPVFVFFRFPIRPAIAVTSETPLVSGSAQNQLGTRPIGRLAGRAETGSNEPRNCLIASSNSGTGTICGGLGEPTVPVTFTPTQPRLIAPTNSRTSGIGIRFRASIE